MNKDNHFSSYFIQLIIVCLLLISVNVQRSRNQVLAKGSVEIQVLKEIVASDLNEDGTLKTPFTAADTDLIGVIALNTVLDPVPVAKITLTRTAIAGPPKFGEVTAATNLFISGSVLKAKGASVSSALVDPGLLSKLNDSFALAIVSVKLTELAAGDKFNPTDPPTVTVNVTSASAELPFSTFLKGDGSTTFTPTFVDGANAALTEAAVLFTSSEGNDLKSLVKSVVSSEFTTKSIYADTGGSGDSDGHKGEEVPDPKQPTLDKDSLISAVKTNYDGFSTDVGTYITDKVLKHFQSLNAFKCEEKGETTTFTDSFVMNFKIVCMATVKAYFVALKSVETDGTDPTKSKDTYTECMDGTKKTVYTAGGTTVAFDNNCTPTYTSNLSDLTSMIGAGNYFSSDAKVTTNSLAEHPIKLSVILLIATAMYIIA